MLCYCWEFRGLGGFRLSLSVAEAGSSRLIGWFLSYFYQLVFVGESAVGPVSLGVFQLLVLVQTGTSQELAGVVVVGTLPLLCWLIAEQVSITWGW